MHSPKSTIVAADLFCGVGGLTLGLEQSGILVSSGYDIDPWCAYAYEKNTSAQFQLKDVASLNSAELQLAWTGADVRMLAACAPCQPFSALSQGRRTEGEDRWKLIGILQKLVSQTTPEIISIENVGRLVHHPIWKRFLTKLDSLGYHIAWDILSAENFGVPQKRKRLVLLGSTLGPISLPSPTSETSTVRNAIGKLPEIAAGEPARGRDFLHKSPKLSSLNLKRIKHSRQGGSWRDWPNDLVSECHKKDTGSTYPSVYGRMCWDIASPTITTQFFGYGTGRFGHPEQNRAISIREGAMLQSFPRNFAFCQRADHATFSRMGMLIGNAVPPLLAKSIGASVVEHVSEL